MPATKEPPPVSAASTAFMKRIEAGVRAFIKQHEVLRPGEHAIVAVSGGPDSTALLLILARLAGRLGLQFTVAHFDHGLRSREEADGDLAVVRSLAGRLGFPAVTGSADVRARAGSRNESIELAAREERYAFLGAQAGALGASAVVLGHTLDDQAETVLLHLVRGSGLDGLVGMRPRSRWPFGAGPDLARPLLQLRRADTERYCREALIEPRRDPTNDLPVATRNQIRHRILPELRALNPRIAEALARLADGVRADIDYLDEMARAQFAALADIGAGRVSLPRTIARLPRPIAARLLRLAAHALADPEELEAVHIDALLALAAGRPGRLSLPGITAVADSARLTLFQGEAPIVPTIPDTPVAIPGITSAGPWTIEATLTEPYARPTGPDPFSALVDAGALVGGLRVRARRTGDRLRPLGLRGHKKLQDILVDAKVPASERDNLPVFETDRGIIWVAGHALDERAAVTPRTEKAVHLRVKARRLLASNKRAR